MKTRLPWLPYDRPAGLHEWMLAHPGDELVPSGRWQVYLWALDRALPTQEMARIVVACAHAELGAGPLTDHLYAVVDGASARPVPYTRETSRALDIAEALAMYDRRAYGAPIRLQNCVPAHVTGAQVRDVHLARRAA